MSWDDQVAMTSSCQGGKSGGDAVGYAHDSAGALAGNGTGYGSSSASFGYAEGTGLGDGGNAIAGARAFGAMGGDVSDNTTIGSINIKS